MIGCVKFKLEWHPPEAEEYFEYLRGEIAGAYASPEWAVTPEARKRFLDEATEATKELQAEACRVYMRCCLPVMVVERGEI